jgi:hypothetical protein
MPCVRVTSRCDLRRHTKTRTSKATAGAELACFPVDCQLGPACARNHCFLRILGLRNRPRWWKVSRIFRLEANVCAVRSTLHLASRIYRPACCSPRSKLTIPPTILLRARGPDRSSFSFKGDRLCSVFVGSPERPDEAGVLRLQDSLGQGHCLEVGHGGTTKRGISGIS